MKNIRDFLNETDPLSLATVAIIAWILIDGCVDVVTATGRAIRGTEPYSECTE